MSGTDTPQSLEFRALGPLEVLRDGRPIDLGPFKQRSLLALLLIHANEVVSVDRIQDELWGDDAGDKANALWVYVSRLRSILEPERTGRGQSSVLITREPGYLLSADPATIDIHRFKMAMAEARSLADADGASQLLTEALGLWRGEAFADFSYEAFARSEVDRLGEARIEAQEELFEVGLRMGRARDLVGELESFSRAHPYRERPVTQLMLALYRSGRQTDALRAFDRHYRVVSEEIGVEPSPELRRIQEQILLHDTSLLPEGERHRAREHADQRPNPYQGLHAFGESDNQHFYGRDELVGSILGRLVRNDRLVAVVGPSGSGKSSVIKAGVVPRLRKMDGEGEWVIAQMVPGAHPYAELEAALLHSRLDTPDSLREQLEATEAAILRAALRVLPQNGARLLLVIDQFEELFTLVDDKELRRRFLTDLLVALEDPHHRISVIVGLRADFYDRPLMHAEFAARLGPSVVNVAPLSLTGVGGGGYPAGFGKWRPARAGVAGPTDRRHGRSTRRFAYVPVHADRTLRTARRRRPHSRGLPAAGRGERRHHQSGRGPVRGSRRERAGGCPTVVPEAGGTLWR